MKYYLHSSTSFADEKIAELFLEFGYEGLGLFYTLLEKIALQEKPIKTVVLKSQLKVGKKLEKCWKFMEQIELISSNNGETFNEQLLKFSEKYEIKKEKNNKRIMEWRDRQHDIKNVTRTERVRNAPKVKISKDKISKVNNKKRELVKIEVLEKVFFTEEENEKVKLKFGLNYQKAIEKLSNYKLSSGKKYDSDYHAIIGWVYEKLEKESGKSKIEKLIEANRDIKIDYENLGKK